MPADKQQEMFHHYIICRFMRADKPFLLPSWVHAMVKKRFEYLLRIFMWRKQQQFNLNISIPQCNTVQEILNKAQASLCF